MKYDTKEEAEKAAEDFGKEKMKEGQFIKIVPKSNEIEVYYGYHTGDLNIKYFKFLKKGDICWCWNANSYDKHLFAFTGFYGGDDPLFSNLKSMELPDKFENHEPIWLNIYDGKDKK
jgi:hypothetical protein